MLGGRSIDVDWIVLADAYADIIDAEITVSNTYT